MRHAIPLFILLSAGCAHQEEPYSFVVQAPPTVIAASTQAALGTAIVKSPTRIVTPWQIVGKETVVQSASGGEFEPIIDRRRFAVLLAPEAGGTVVTVRQDFETCPPDMPADRSRTADEACVRTSEVLPGDQAAIDRLGRQLQAKLSGAGLAGHAVDH